MQAFVDSVEPSPKPVTWLAAGDRRGIARMGAVSLSSPQIAREAWARRVLGDAAYGICGITHTTATGRAMDAIADSFVVVGSRSYVRVYERVGDTNQYQSIPLDVAGV